METMPVEGLLDATGKAHVLKETPPVQSAEAAAAEAGRANAAGVTPPVQPFVPAGPKEVAGKIVQNAKGIGSVPGPIPTVPDKFGQPVPAFNAPPEQRRDLPISESTRLEMEAGRLATEARAKEDERIRGIARDNAAKKLADGSTADNSDLNTFRG